MSDTDLIQRFRAGDADAFAALIEAHQHAIFGFFRARVMRPTDAEDLTQEVFLRFYQNRRRLVAESPVRPWLFGIARNLLREYCRRVSRRKEVAWTTMCLELDEIIPPDDTQHEDALKHLPDCLNSLGPSARQAVKLKYQDNLKLAVIGEKLKRSEGAIKLLVYRARQALKHCLTGKLRRTGHDA